MDNFILLPNLLTKDKTKTQSYYAYIRQERTKRRYFLQQIQNFIHRKALF